MGRKGDRAERELMELLWRHGYAVVRSAGSGLSYAPDVVAIKRGRVLGFECKAWRRDRVTIRREQAVKLMEWSERSGAELYLAWKYPYRGWLFVPFSRLRLQGAYYAVTWEEAERLSVNPL